MAGSKGSKHSREPGYPELFGRALVDLATQVFGGRMDRSTWPPEDQDAGARTPAATGATESPEGEAAEVLEHALSKAETLLTRMEERAAAPPAATPTPDLQETSDLLETVRGVLQDLMESALLLQAERGRMNAEISRLAAIADRLESAAATAGAIPGRERATTPSSEPSFAPDNGALDVIVGAVPGFQGLMDTQRSLTALPAVSSASVQSYRNGEAALAVVLEGQVTPAQVVDALSETTGHSLLIEEVRPEAHRLRLRFVNGA
jgi:hypothetical protein